MAKAHKVNNEVLLKTQNNKHESLNADNKPNQTAPEGWCKKKSQENPSRRLDEEFHQEHPEKPDPVIYKTDEEEFMEPGQDDVKPAVCYFTAMYTVHSTQYTVRRPVKNTARRKTAIQSGPNLAYFTL